MFCCNALKLRITFQPVMQKARVVEPKTQCCFVDNHESIVGESVWWAWPQPFARCIDIIFYMFITQVCASNTLVFTV